MLTLDALSKTYADGTEALRRVSLTIPNGEIVALLGGSGCGKTTLLRLVAGLDAPSAGHIRLDDESIVAPHASVGIIFQEPRLLPWLTIAQNAGFGLMHLPEAKREALVANALTRVGLEGQGGRWPRELSGGQQQRVAIARALVTRPKLLLMDEPFSALDAMTRASLHRHLLSLWEESRPTVLMVTHDVEEAVTLGDRIMVMQPHPGRIFDELHNPLARPRDVLSPAFEGLKRSALRLLDESINADRRHVPREAETAGLWW
ncbi:MAG: ABC transporter ATP-binding protein [Bosea sp. (in: a-proteobacteria)]